MTEITLSTQQEKVLLAFGLEANKAASQTVFIEYRIRKAKNTVERQSRELAKFAQFAGIDFDLSTNPQGWKFVTWGIVDGFIKSLLMQGYATGTLNIILSTIKRYAKLALRSGTLLETEYRMIITLSPFGYSEGKNTDEKRQDQKIPTRIGSKKESFQVLDDAQITTIKSQCDISPQGTRDMILLTLLFDFGLRVSEIANLKASDFDPATGKLTVNRQKTKSQTVFTLVNGKLALFKKYFETYKPTDNLLLGSHKTGCLTGKMSIRAIQNRFEQLCSNVGIAGISCHDARHTCATIKGQTMGTRQMMHFFGWNSEKMAIAYQKPQDDNLIE